MYDQEQRDWLAGRDYEMAAAPRAKEPVPPPDEFEPDSPPEQVSGRDALLGDLGGGPSLELLDRFSRTRHVEDDDPPGMGS